MKINLIIKAIFIFFFVVNNHAQSNEKIAFLDMELVVKNSNIGKSILIKISNLDKENVEKLKIQENKLKDQEEEIKKKQNIISKEQLEKEIINLKKNINNFRLEKDKMVDKIRETKNKELSDFYKKINPIIQSYMDKNNISILLDVKNIVIGRSNNNITNDIIEKINNELK